MKDERTEAEVIRDAYAPAHLTLRAPVQGYGGGIPWSIHLEAYDAYVERYGRQTALIDLKGRGCRGGFGTKELDSFVPGWRDRVSELGQLRAEVEQLRAAGAALSRDARVSELLEANNRAVEKRRQATGLLRQIASDYPVVAHRINAFLLEIHQ